MKRFLVERPKNKVEVLLLPNKDGSGWQYVNLSKGHICPCKFDSKEEALADMIRRMNDRQVLSFTELGEMEVGVC